jgi:tetratricopeptide (TPR) repeat protein
MPSLFNGEIMTLFQLILFIAAVVIFYLFFKKLFSEDYPKRGIDFEAKNADAQIGGVSRPDKIFSRPAVKPDRVQELIEMADKSVEEGDTLEAKKALQSALILDENNPEILRRYAYVLNAMNDFVGAREHYEKVLEQTPDDDLSESALAIVLRHLGEFDEALRHHERAIALDPEYAPHYFNYANTLYEMGRREEALTQYEKAYALDPSLEEAKEIIAKLKKGESL